MMMPLIQEKYRSQTDGEVWVAQTRVISLKEAKKASKSVKSQCLILITASLIGWFNGRLASWKGGSRCDWTSWKKEPSLGKYYNNHLRIGKSRARTGF